MDVSYQLEPGLTPDEFVDVLRRSALAERRPVDGPDTNRGMLEHADVIVTVRTEGKLIGVSRAVTDFSYCRCLADLLNGAPFGMILGWLGARVNRLDTHTQNNGWVLELRHDSSLQRCGFRGHLLDHQRRRPGVSGRDPR